MTTHNFTLQIQGDTATEEMAEALFEAGCDDGTLSSGLGRISIEFNRVGKDLASAIVSAIRQVEGAGYTVQAVADSPVVLVSDIAERCGVHRQTVHQWANGKRGSGGFPAPISDTTGIRPTRVWRWLDVATWLEAHGLATDVAERAQLVSALNAFLGLRHAKKGIVAAIAGLPAESDVVRGASKLLSIYKNASAPDLWASVDFGGIRETDEPLVDMTAILQK